MNKLLVVGHPLSGYEKIFDLLTQSGMQPARASRREGMEPREITRTLLKAAGHEGADTIKKVEVAPIWNGLALDLMLGNIDQSMWCWADPDAVSLLEYWQNIDSRLGFVLVYGSPEDFIVDRFDGVGEIGDDELSDALDEWHRYNKALMNFFLRNPERSYLVHSANIIRNTRECIEHVGAALMLPLSPGDLQHSLEPPFVDRDVYRYLSAEMLCRHPEIVGLYEELQSVADMAYAQNPRSTQGAKEAWASLVRLKTELETTILRHESALGESARQLDIKSVEYAHMSALSDEMKKRMHEIESDLLHERSEREKLSADAVRQSEENELLLTQLHLVQEELERYYLENQALKKQGGMFHKPKNTRHYGAAERVREQLSYRLGAAMIANAKSPLGWISMPFALMAVRKRYREEQKAKAGKKLPKISEYADAYEAEKVKKHLSYRLGSAMIETMHSPLGIVKLPFALAKAAKSYKEERK